MIGDLPKVLTVDGAVYPINSDYRAALAIMSAFNDPALSYGSQVMIMLEILYDFNVPRNIEQARRQALWFLDCGRSGSISGDIQPTIDWVKDEQLIFAAVNAVTKCEVRAAEYRHWWTFVCDCESISPDSLIAAVVNIRTKQARGEKLEPHEQRFYRQNRGLVDISQESERHSILKALRGEH